MVRKIGISEYWNQGMLEIHRTLQHQQNIPDAYLEPSWTSAVELFFLVAKYFCKNAPS